MLYIRWMQWWYTAFCLALCFTPFKPKSTNMGLRRYWLPYSTLSSPHQNNQYFPKFVMRTRQRWFLCPKIFQNFLLLFPKRATGGLFDYYSIVSQEEKQKIGDHVHNKFEGIIFFIKFLLKNFKVHDSSKFTGC